MQVSQHQLKAQLLDAWVLSFWLFFYKTFSFSMIKDALEESVKTTALVFAILVGATAFSMVFSYTGGDEIVENFMTNYQARRWGFHHF